jgi:hypothetical protein
VFLRSEGRRQIQNVPGKKKRTMLVQGAFHFCTSGDSHWIYA